MKISDENKDKYLVSQGWEVIRVKWKKPTKEFREELVSTLLRISNT
jgi:very-short-patch-repair endonuclease